MRRARTGSRTRWRDATGDHRAAVLELMFKGVVEPEQRRAQVLRRERADAKRGRGRRRRRRRGREGRNRGGEPRSRFRRDQRPGGDVPVIRAESVVKGTYLQNAYVCARLPDVASNNRRRPNSFERPLVLALHLFLLLGGEVVFDVESLRISSGVLPLIMFATVMQVRSSRDLMLR